MSIWDDVLVWHHWGPLLHPHFTGSPSSLWLFLNTYLLINSQLSGCQSALGICPPLFFYMRSHCSLASNILVVLMILKCLSWWVLFLECRDSRIHLSPGLSTLICNKYFRHIQWSEDFFDSVSCMDQNVGVIVPKSLVALRTTSKPLWVQWALPLAFTLNLSASHYLSATAQVSTTNISQQEKLLIPYTLIPTPQLKWSF